MRNALLAVALVSLAPLTRAQAPCTPTLAPDMGYAGLPVSQMVAFDDGSGPALYLPGNVYGAAMPQIYKWNGSALTPVFGTAPCYPGLLAVHDDGAGPALYAAGQTWPLQPTYGVWKWDGASWVQQGGAFYPTIHALTSWVDPLTSQRKLVACGQFVTIGGVSTPHLAAWDGSTWSSIGGAAGVPNAFVANLAFEPAGPLAGLYASGFFTSIGAVATPSKVARFDGTSWTAVGTGFGDYGRMHFFDDGSGRALYLGARQTLPGGGLTQLLARWNGTSWSSVGAPAGLAGISAFETFDDGAGAQLYLSGYAANHLTPTSVQRWNGTSLSVVAEMNGSGSGLATLDAGAGPKLHVAGGFSSSNGRVVHGFARWNGAALEPLVEGGGLTGTVWSFAGHDDGTGAAVYAAGELYHAGGQGGYGVARWRDTHWESVGGSFVYMPFAVATLDLGGGPELYATSSVGPWPGP